ncbi:MAG: polysaccharide biosynthesis/export family protein [Bryobacteraceae bacterium]
MSAYKFLTLVSLFAMGSIFALAQNPVAVPNVPTPVAIRPDYVLGPNDQILVRSNVEELSERPFRVDADGVITFPLINRLPVTGLTVQALEIELANRLREFYQQPQVGIMITGFRDEPVSFFGAFAKPGVYPLSGGRTLRDMLAVAGGFLPNASRRLRVTRRIENGVIPLASATQDVAAGTSTVEINLDTLLRELNPEEDIVLEAYDRVTVEQSQPVYVNGEVIRAAPLELVGRDTITVMQALTQAGGFTAAAKRGKVSVLRPVEGTARLAQIEIDIQRIIEGKDNDFPLFPNDILYVPRLSGFASMLPQAGTSLMSSLPFVIISALLR